MAQNMISYGLLVLLFAPLASGVFYGLFFAEVEPSKKLELAWDRGLTWCCGGAVVAIVIGLGYQFYSSFFGG